jgi:hypothetical protein
MMNLNSADVVTNRQTGIPLSVDGFSDFAGQLGGILGGGVISGGRGLLDRYISREFPERTPPAPQGADLAIPLSDNAVNESKNNSGGRTQAQMQQYGIYVIAGAAVLATFAFIFRR